MANRKSNIDKWALVIYSALSGWGLPATIDECRLAAEYLQGLVKERLISELPKTYKNNTQSKP